MERKILDRLRLLKEELFEHYGIKKLAVFGSVARKDYKENSDIDIVILEMENKNGFKIASAKVFLEEKLGMSVDIGLYESLNPFIKDIVSKEMINV